jgi:lactoylglutathione lyase
MPDRPAVTRLFETHLLVRDLQRSIGFYRDVVGLELAFEVPERDVAFFWIGGTGRSMLGLWGIGSAPMRMELHIAFEVALDDLLEAPRQLRDQNVTPLSFFGQETDEPSVIGWMPAAIVYFRDPDGNLLEYLAMLDEQSQPERGIVPFSEWTAATTSARTA